MDKDNVLMEKAKDGDKKAYEELVLKHRKGATLFAIKYIGDSFIAEDIVQDSFVAVYINRHKYKSNNSFKTYLYTIVRNKSIDYLRKKQIIYVDQYEEVETENVEDIVIKNEYKEVLYNLFNQLNDDYKNALYLYEFEGMSYKNIATVMKKSVPQIKINIYRARKKLISISKEVSESEGR